MPTRRALREVVARRSDPSGRRRAPARGDRARAGGPSPRRRSRAPDPASSGRSAGTARTPRAGSACRRRRCRRPRAGATSAARIAPSATLVVVGERLGARQEVLLVEHLVERRGVGDVRPRRAIAVDAIADRAERMVERDRRDVERRRSSKSTPGSTWWKSNCAGTASSGIGKNSWRVMPPITWLSSSAAVSSA